MAEPQPPDVHEGASTPPPPTGTAEDRKAAAALSSLDTHDDDGSSPKANTDAAALGEAMKNLGVGEKAETVKKVEEAPKKAVKVDAVDVGLLVEQLELSRAKATELLKAHEGDAVKAMTAFVTASA
ncbi:uncharacterized protein BDZ99DRAFT_458611 [Mytilinidion resinicola]|uniref:Nascent polypeptide-associated complex subunit alpha-like UBA domain-containing protein n=1 Tax=Mytilinidion resinicola TaxID=574789 RepID=A0A6A6Z2Y6_9PEZI|nr:uncharacterized protein BDZ99DRAFT_458611 [Mytilinidion resinicola]KAF2814607.1 hypothetical protein BDZ99DRAFT_458611 [Mytilinidion resinicola]